MQRIHCSAWDRKSLLRALRASTFVRRATPGSVDMPVDKEFFKSDKSAFLLYDPVRTQSSQKEPSDDRRAGVWRYLVEVDDAPVAIKRCAVTYPYTWCGPWPYPMPRVYEIVRDKMDLRVSASVFDSQSYTDANTKAYTLSR